MEGYPVRCRGHRERQGRIYGDSFLDITDLNKLPVKLAGIIKRFIRV